MRVVGGVGVTNGFFLLLLSFRAGDGIGYVRICVGCPLITSVGRALPNTLERRSGDQGEQLFTILRLIGSDHGANLVEFYTFSSN